MQKQGAARRRNAWSRLGPALLTLLCACGSLLGIDEPIFGEGTAGSSGGISSGGSNGGASSSAGRAADAGDGPGGQTSAGGPSRESGGTSNGGRGDTGGGAIGAGGASAGRDTGSAGDSGAGGGGGNGATGGEGGSGGVITVRGKVENRWGYPLKDVVVTIGAASATTDATGSFEIADVTPPYDAWFVAVTMYDQKVRAASELWLFRGLTRAKPVFRVKRGGFESSADVDLEGTHAASGAILGGSVGAPQAAGFQTTMAGTAVVNILFRGAPKAITTGTAHVLTHFADAKTGLPTSYSAYATQSIDVDSSRTYLDTLTFDLTPSDPPLVTKTIGGVVTTAGTESRTNSLWLRFDNNAALLLAQHEATSAEFSYLVPELPASNLTLVAAESSMLTWDSLAIAYQSGISPGQSNVELDIPAPSELLGPKDGESIDAATEFAWQNAMPVSVLTLSNWWDQRHIHVVTAEKLATIPDALIAAVDFWHEAGNCVWIVETYGAQPSVDAAVSGSDFVPAFMGSEFPGGNGRESGVYTRSVARAVQLPSE